MNHFLQRNTFFIFILFLVLGVYGFLHIKNELTNTRQLPKSSDSTHQLNAFKIIEYDQQGKIKQILRAKSIVQKTENEVLLTAPRIKRMLASGKRNEISSDTGFYFPNTSTFHFNDNVVIKEFDLNKHKLLSRMKTSSLVFNTKTELATTKEWVEIDKENLNIDALGIVSDLKKGTLSFPGKTKMHYKNIG